MSLENLEPTVRVEAILDGADIDPATRLEYFLSKAANEVPKPTGSSDAGKVLTVNDDGDGFILDEVDPGLPDISGASDAGKVVTVNAGGSAYELTTPSGGGNTVITALDDDVLDIIAGKLTTLLAACTDSAVHHLNPSGSVGNITEAVYNAVKAAYDTNGAVVYKLTLSDVLYFAPTRYSVSSNGDNYEIVLPIGNYSDAYNITFELLASKSGNTYTLLVGGYASAMTAVQ